MLDITLLGTGGMMPLPSRHLTSLMARYEGKTLLIDCGEGTQTAIDKAKLPFVDIDTICITHFHGDHINGLSGVLLRMVNSGKTEPVTIIGPKGIERICNGLLIASPIKFKLNFIEIEKPGLVHTMNGMEIYAIKLSHTMECYGYTLNVKRLRKFDIEKAQANNIDRIYWNDLQHGVTVELKDRILTPDMVLGKKRKGIKVTYCTDTRPVKSIIETGKDSDLFICEGMYGTDEDIQLAKEKKHMLFSEAAKVARDMNTKELWLTHYSPKLYNPQDYLNVAKKHFENTLVSKDGQSKTIVFED